MYANPNVIGRAKTKDCRMIPGHFSPPLSCPAIFLSVCAFLLDLYVRMPFQGRYMIKSLQKSKATEILLKAWKFQNVPKPIIGQYDISLIYAKSGTFTIICVIIPKDCTYLPD